MKTLVTFSALLIAASLQAQLVVQSGATLFIDAGATVTVQGDVTSNANITGTGKLEMKGSSLQTLNMNGFTIPNLRIDNASHVNMSSAARVDGVLEFVNGKLQLSNSNFVLGPSGSFTGAGAGKFAETNGSGYFQQLMTAGGTATLPVGVGTSYTPLAYTSTGGSYAGGAYVGTRSVSGGHPQKHVRSTDYLNSYWMLQNSGISGATMSAVGTYADPTSITGIETDIRGMRWDGTNWNLATNDVAANTVSTPVSGATNELYGMNRFVLATPTVMLQGAYDAGTNRMRDRLRHSSGSYTPGNAGLNNILPSSDPYRSAPYSSFFTHTANTVAEAITSAAVFNDQANADHNIVDWVFVELRNVTGATSAPVIQTRSALLRRDGILVDIDGVSPVYFKNVDAGNNFALSVRHRNHLGISTNPSSPVALNLANSSQDLTVPGAAVMGTSGVNYASVNGRNIVWAGNPRNNASVNWSGLNNDKDYLYINVLGSNSSGSIAAYSIGDLNMNRVANWSGLNNDKDYLYITILGSNSSTSKAQALPSN